MGREDIKLTKVGASGGEGYPSLSEFITDRRRFLAMVGGAFLAGAVGCVGEGGSKVGEKDDFIDSGFTMGVPPMPNYHSLRLPLEGYVSVLLADGGHLTCAATAWTYSEEMALTLASRQEEMVALVTEVLGGYAYNDLSTDEGLMAAARELALRLEGAAGVRGEISEVVMEVDSLYPGVEIGGIVAEPEYPEGAYFVTIPEEGGRGCTLADGAYLEFAVVANVARWEFVEAIGREEGEVLDRFAAILSSLSSADLMEPGSLGDLERALADELREFCREATAMEEGPCVRSLKLSIREMEEGMEIMGDVAYPEFP